MTAARDVAAGAAALEEEPRTARTESDRHTAALEDERRRLSTEAAQAGARAAAEATVTELRAQLAQQAQDEADDDPPARRRRARQGKGARRRGHLTVAGVVSGCVPSAC